MKKNDKSGISIIGGADGPTSIFIAGRTGKRPLKVRIKNWIYCQKRRRIAVKIRPNPHTLKQVTAFMKMEYGAAEVSKESRQYQERKASLREGLIIQNRPELLEGLEEMKRPEVFTKEAMEEIDDLSQEFSFCKTYQSPENLKQFIEEFLNGTSFSIVKNS